MASGAFHIASSCMARCSFAAGLGEEHDQALPAVGQVEVLEAQRDVAHQRMVEPLHSVGAFTHVALGPQAAEGFAAHGELAQQGGKALVVWVLPGGEA
ncbi:hypothetical protein Areg01_20470 [Actinoplanes regularis]|nr:hypothetical protein Areg01_20470 [Actinoplanes regularis]